MRVSELPTVNTRSQSQSTKSAQTVDDLGKSLKLLQDKTEAIEKQQRGLDNKMRSAITAVQESDDGDRISLVSKPALAAVSCVLAPESGAAKVPESVKRSSEVCDKVTWQASCNLYADGQGQDAVQAVFSPTTRDQFFLNTKNNGTLQHPDSNTIAMFAAPPLAANETSPAPGVMAFIENDQTEYIDNKGEFRVEYEYVQVKSDHLKLQFPDLVSGLAMEILDNAANPITMFDAAGNNLGPRIPVETTEINVYYGGVPLVEEVEDTIYIPLNLITGFRFYANPLANKHTFGVLVTPTKSVANPGNTGDLRPFADSNGTQFTGFRFPTLVENGSDSVTNKMLKRVVGADCILSFVGGYNDNGYIRARTFEDTVAIPPKVSRDDWLTSGKNVSFSGPIAGKNKPGCRAWYIPELNSKWRDLMTTLRNNPWTGAFELDRFYLFATRFHVTSNNGSRVAAFKSNYIYSMCGSGSLFNYAAVSSDPMWPNFHAAMLEAYRISSNDGHWDYIENTFKSVLAGVWSFGKNLLTNNDVQEVLKAGAKVAIPAILSAVAMI